MSNAWFMNLIMRVFTQGADIAVVFQIHVTVDAESKDAEVKVLSQKFNLYSLI